MTEENKKKPTYDELDNKLKLYILMNNGYKKALKEMIDINSNLINILEIN